MKRWAWVLLALPVFAVQPMDPLFVRVMDAVQTRSDAPFSLKWSPDGRQLAYLKRDPETEQNRLMLMDPARQEERELVGVSRQPVEETEAEKALKERMRIGGGGITWFEWMPDGREILYKAEGDLKVVNTTDGRQRTISLSSPLKPLLFPLVSPDGTRIACVSKGDVYQIRMADGAVTRLTASADGDAVYNGMAEFVAAEELGRYTGMWWSPDSRYLFVTHVNETKMARVAIPDNHELEHRYEVQRYPFAGGVNAEVTLNRITVADGKLEPVPVPWDGEYYLVRVHFMENDLALQVISRDQKDLAVFRYTGLDPKAVYREHDDTWINLTGAFHYFPERRAFLWRSETSGSSQLYLVGMGGRMEPLTDGPVVRRVVRVTDRKIWYICNGKTPNDSAFYVLDLKTGRKRELAVGGSIRASVSPDGKYAWLFRSDLNTPSRAELMVLETGRVTELYRTRVPEIDGLAAGVRERFQFAAADGTVLYGVLDRPAKLEPGRRYPVLVYTYGGPHAQVAGNGFSIRNVLWHRYLNSRGICVFRMDNRGSSNRTRAFERAIFRNMGDLELRDQIAGLDALCKSRPWLDRSRSAIWGWSYGGYMTCMAMTRFAGAFNVGVAVAPVTDWQLYDSAYTERYMETPDTNPQGYRTASVLTWAERLSGKLLIVHGVSDDNVHFQNTEVLLAAFSRNGKYPDLMVYPGKKHSIRGNQTRKHLFWLITDYLLENL